AVTKGVLREGMTAKVGLDDGQQIDARIEQIRSAEKGRFEVVLKPVKPTPRQFELIRGSNVRVTIPVKSTEGKVLAVPVAALSAGPGGESRVEVLRGKKVELVQVEIGLSAQGYAEVRPTRGRLRPGDQVVVGR
ncbi:MAG TPA: peptidoglycan-binding protein, partial [Actinopolymorphaceae bacterium]